jgi:hypothetical protein
VLSLLLVSACGRQEKTEGVQLAKALNEKKTAFAKICAEENLVVDQVRKWSSDIVSNGAGKGPQLEQNALTALELSKNAVNVGNELSTLRQSISNIPLTTEEPGTIRANVMGEFSKRQRYLHELKTLLENSAPGFRQLAEQKSYKGDSFPAGLDKLNGMVTGYNVREGTLDEAVASLKEKFEIADTELK